MEIDVYLLFANIGRFATALMAGCLIIGVFLALIYWSDKQDRKRWPGWDR